MAKVWWEAALFAITAGSIRQSPGVGTEQGMAKVWWEAALLASAAGGLSACARASPVARSKHLLAHLAELLLSKGCIAHRAPLFSPRAKLA